MNEIEKLYDCLYQEIVNYQKQLDSFQQSSQALSEEEQEQVERMEMALQASKDILENMLTPGKKLNFIYEKGSVSLEMFRETKR